MKKTMTIYTWGERTGKRGQLAAINPSIRDVSGDWDLYAEGSREHCVDVARADYRTANEAIGPRANFELRRAKSVLDGLHEEYPGNLFRFTAPIEATSTAYHNWFETLDADRLRHASFAELLADYEGPDHEGVGVEVSLDNGASWRTLEGMRPYLERVPPAELGQIVRENVPRSFLVAARGGVVRRYSVECYTGAPPLVVPAAMFEAPPEPQRAQ